MIVLDTNVLSALMQRQPVPAVLDWLDRQPSNSLWTTSITVFEVQHGIERLPRGRRRDALRAAFDGMVSEDLAGRVLEFDVPAAAEAARISAALDARGRPVDMRDVLIAGVVSSRRGALATRNARHFEGTGIALLDPWAPAG
ncbi:MAG: type II toxin-antitoxin system VapC family toxin [Phycisphaerales bacterium]|nr:type II toxin-antitoxin system VapC family toxin [Phycisphaerales bacterium]